MWILKGAALIRDPAIIRGNTVTYFSLLQQKLFSSTHFFNFIFWFKKACCELDNQMSESDNHLKLEPFGHHKTTWTKF